MISSQKIKLLLQLIIGCGNLGFGLLYGTFLETTHIYFLLSPAEIQIHRILGISCIIVGVITLIVPFNKPIYNAYINGQEKIRNYNRAKLLRIEQQEIERKKVKFNFNPTNAEESLEILNELQKEIENLIKNSNFSESIDLLANKVRIYEMAIKFFLDLGFKAIIPKLKVEKSKTQELWYNIAHNIWINNYNSTSKNIEDFRNLKRYADVNTEIKRIYEFITQRINLAQKFKKEDDKKLYQKLLVDYQVMEQINNFHIQYLRLEDEYNSISTMIHHGTLSNAFSQSNQLYTKIVALEQESSRLIAQFNQDKYFISIVKALKKLQIETEKLTPLIESQFETKFAGVKETKISISQINANINLPEMSKIDEVELKEFIEALDSQFKTWTGEEKDKKSKK